jgi:hypothetical protein
MSIAKASLRLFGGVVAQEGTKGIVISQYGLYIPAEAVYALFDIRQWAEEELVSSEQLNNTFYSSWKVVAESTDEELLEQQLLHYMGTYGMKALGLPQLIYIPANELDIPIPLTVKIVTVFTKEEAVAKVTSLLTSSVAFKQQTIVDAIDMAQGLDVDLGELKVENLEAAVLIADKTGVLPKDADLLFRYFVYKTTGNTLVVKDRKTLAAISSSGYVLPCISAPIAVQLSKSFNRRKEYWLAFKKASGDNAAVINKISKLSKKFHAPMKPSILLTLTSEIWNYAEVESAAMQANPYQLVRAINAVRFYSEPQSDRLYSVRNGKGYYKTKDRSLKLRMHVGPTRLESYAAILLNALKEKVGSVTFYCDDHISYACPTSEKKFFGSVPYGTRVRMTGNVSHLVGVRWEYVGLDLDLKAVSEGHCVGWNSGFRGKGLMHSGDMTYGPATEWLYANGTEMENEYLITLCNYSGGRDSDIQFKLLVAYSDEKRVSENYTCHPDDVVFTTSCDLTQNNVILGALMSGEDCMDLYLTGGGVSNRRVDSYNPILDGAIKTKLRSMLRLEEVFDRAFHPDDADVDLSISKVGRESIIDLFG